MHLFAATAAHTFAVAEKATAEAEATRLATKLQRDAAEEAVEQETRVCCSTAPAAHTQVYRSTRGNARTVQAGGGFYVEKLLQPAVLIDTTATGR